MGLQGYVDKNVTSEVTASGNLTDNALVRGDGGAKGIQTSTVLVSDNGEMTNPSQPAFLAQKSVDQDNATGNGTTATIAFTTEVFDQNGDYDGTNTFTAPVTGKYYFFVSVLMDQLATGTVGIVNIVTSNRTIQLINGDFDAMSQSGGGGSLTVNGSCFVDMDATDTAKVQVTVTGIGADTADIPASSVSHFGGFLVC